MKAVIFDAPGKVRITNASTPEMKPGEVLLKINMVGLCGTDLNIYKGNMPLVSFPRIPGHEISAEIIDKGNEVPYSIKIGNAVTVNPYTSCGKCTACRAGRFNTCMYNQTMGVQRDGAMSQYFSIPYLKVFQNNILSRKELALVEPLSVGYHATNRGKVSENETVLVLGSGMIGIGVALAALQKKATVIVLDIDEKKLSLMKSLGVHHTVNSKREEALKTILDITNGEGPDVCIEAVGAAPTYRLALEASSFGGRIVCIGYAHSDISLNTSLIVKKELDVMGSRNALDEFSDVISMLEEKKFKTDRLITSVCKMDDLHDAFEYWKDNPGEVIKILAEIE